MPKIYEQENGVNVIAEGSNLTGNIVTSGDCRIDGNMKGNIQSNAKVIIGETGVVEGEIICKNIEIEGKAKANINVGDLLSLRSNAVLMGNIIAGKLSIEPGANFVGNCKMQNSKVEIPIEKQEDKHCIILEEIIKLTSRPDEWVESAEFGPREDY